MKKILLSIAVLIGTGYSSLIAQQANVTRCSTDEYMQSLKTQDPGLESRLAAIEKQTEDWINAHPNGKTSNLTITIPVIVHVVYNTAVQNIPDYMIKSQIDVLNEDYGGYNSDVSKVPPFFRGVKAGDTGIRFKLATRDPSGNTTTGIIRVSTTITQFPQGSTINNVSPAWPAASYLNIWVCNLGSGLLGYAQFPGGPASTDGVVLLYTAFGRPSPYPGGAYAYGRTVTHEVGHWLNLRHIWGDDGTGCTGTDQVTDTPNAAGTNFGAFSCHTFTCSNQPTGDMYMNYMDYTDDRYMFMLTAGQNLRMQACLSSTRASLNTSLGLNVVSPPANDCGISDIITPGGIPCDNILVTFIPEVTLTNFGSNALTSATINFKIDSLGALQTQAWSGTLAAGASTNVTLPSMTSTTGDHLFYAWTTNPNGTTDATGANDRTQRNFIGHAANAPYPISQGFESLPFPPIGWSNKNYDCNLKCQWARTDSAAHSGTYSAVFRNYTATSTLNGVMDELITQTIDMSSAPANAVLKFWKAYAEKSLTSFDTLEVLASTDCGYNFASIYKEWALTLATAPATATSFIPTSSQWAEVTVNLAPFVGQKNLILAFRNINHGGNNLYIDDLNVTVVSVNEVIAGVNLNVYPNPTEGLLNVSTKFENPENMQIIVTDALGQAVYKTHPKTTMGELTTLDLRSASKGIYFVELRTEKGSVVKKVSLSN
jgi:pregnancy-associated plasma protein-A/type IX secretion system substrate protein